MGARAARHADAVGIGWYAMDLHDCVGNPTSMFAPTLPFQIPLGALIPADRGNLLAACKNIGTTQVTNGAYRPHPIEWNIGESAGALAAFCCATGRTPSEVWGERLRSQRLQYRLLKRGIPIAWTVNVPQGHELFLAAQMLVAWGAISPESARYRSLALNPDAPLTLDEAEALVEAGLALARRSLGAQGARSQKALGQAVARRADVERLLRESGLPVPAIADPLRWGEVAAVFAPLMQQALEES